jgi:hypothetical protein
MFDLIPVFMMMGVMLVNQAVIHQRTEWRNDIEASRFRAALAAEMRALLDLYETNLDFLARGLDVVLSARQIVPVYKGNLGRLTIVLKGDVVARMVAAFAQTEKMEAILCARDQPRNGSCYKLAGDMDIEEFKALLMVAVRETQAACQALEARDGRVESWWGTREHLRALAGGPAPAGLSR